MTIAELRLFDACAEMQRALVVMATADDGATKVGAARFRSAVEVYNERRKALRDALVAARASRSVAGTVLR